MKILKKILIILGIIVILFGIYYAVTETGLIAPAKGTSRYINWYNERQYHYETWDDEKKEYVNGFGMPYPNDSTLIGHVISKESDIPGYTLSELLGLGISISDGYDKADDDGDGLTNYDEIVTYKTDPAMTSSANDMYPDGYKIAQGMDINAYCPYDEGNPLFDYEKDGNGNYIYNVDERLTALTPSAGNLTVAEISSAMQMQEDKDYNYLAIFTSHFYYGDIRVDFSEFPENSVILTYNDEGRIVEAEAEKTDDGLIYTIDQPKHTFAVGVKRGLFDAKIRYNSANSLDGKKSNDKGKEEEKKTTGKVLVTMIPFLQLDGSDSKVYYEDLGDDKLNEKMRAAAIDIYHNATSCHIKHEDKVVKVSKWYLDFKCFIRQYLFPYFEYRGEFLGLEYLFTPRMLYMYYIGYADTDDYVYESPIPVAEEEAADSRKEEDSGKDKKKKEKASDKNKEDDEDEKEPVTVLSPDDNKIVKEYKDISEKHTTFDIVRDTFSFVNVGSYIGIDGICSGYAKFAVDRHNLGESPTVKSDPGNTEVSYITDMDIIEPAYSKDNMPKSIDLRWDMTIGEQNSKLIQVKSDLPPSKYMDADFDSRIGSTVMRSMEDESIRFYDMSSLTDEEVNFVNYISGLWYQFNHNIDRVNGRLLCPGSHYLSAKTLDNIKAYIDNDKLLYLAIGKEKPYTGGSIKFDAHCLVIYEYEYDKKDDSVMYLDVYDCNYTYDNNGNEDNIKKTRVKVILNEDDTIDFEYAPTKDSMIYSSYEKETYIFDILDEKYNYLTRFAL